VLAGLFVAKTAELAAGDAHRECADVAGLTADHLGVTLRQSVPTLRNLPQRM